MPEEERTALESEKQDGADVDDQVAYKNGKVMEVLSMTLSRNSKVGVPEENEE